MPIFRTSMSFIAAALIASTTTAAVAQSVPVPGIRIGDVWEYEIVDDWTSQVRVQERQEVIGLMNEFVRLRTEGKTRNLRTGAMEPRGVEEETQRADMNVDFPGADGRTQRRLNYLWPLEVGKKWNYEYSVNSQGNNGQAITVVTRFQAEVTGWDTVTTPAGSFRALKIVHNGTVESASFPVPSRVGWVFWYAPQVGSYVKTTYQWDSASGTPGARTTTTLMSFKRGAD